MRLRNAKAKGSRRERQSRDRYRDAGFIVVKAGGSLGAADLVALHPEQGMVHFVQVKSNRAPGRVEMIELRHLAARCKIPWQVVIHRWNDRKGLTVTQVKP